MSRQAVETLVDRWLNDSTFRERVRQDPEGTIRGTGVHLDPDEWAALRSVDWRRSDEDLALQARDSKVF